MRCLNKNRNGWMYDAFILLKIMTVFLNFYIVIYLITMIKLNFILTNLVFNYNSQQSLSQLITYILKFNKFKSIIFGLFLSLAGLPPFIMFFIKFNFLINLLYKNNIFIILLIFFIFFLNMLFYIQVFFHKNVNISFKLIKNKKNLLFKLNEIYFIMWFLIFNFFSVFFFTDFLFIFKLTINGNI